MKTYRGAFLTNTRWRWVVSFNPCHSTPRERATGTHWAEGWVGRRASLDVVAKIKHYCSCWELNPRHPAHNLVTTLSYYGSQVIFQYISVVFFKYVLTTAYRPQCVC